MPLPAHYAVAEGLIAGAYPARRPRPSRGLERVGVTVFVDLTHPSDPLESYGHFLDGARRIAHPIPDMGTPTAGHVMQILDDIDAARADGGTVYVHCWGGVGRTGTVVGCWLVRHGLDDGDAIATIAGPAPGDRRRAPLARDGRPGRARPWLEARLVKRLWLLRHAKSSWDEPGLADHDRPLAPRGRKAAQRIRTWAAENDVRPDLVLCSTAVRARATLDLVAAALGAPEVESRTASITPGKRSSLARLRRVPARCRRAPPGRPQPRPREPRRRPSHRPARRRFRPERSPSSGSRSTTGATSGRAVPSSCGSSCRASCRARRPASRPQPRDGRVEEDVRRR